MSAANPERQRNEDAKQPPQRYIDVTMSRSLLTKMGEALVIRRENWAAAGDGLGVLRS
ncbi:hypothetical protein GCM10009655_12730 [Rhodoglobus aureus]|uniref:Uncharacterized protein n=1 Tax=Rhodoglobus aureus TaxID=191497 RepID=A0ABN1VPF1_9MICO